MYRVSFLGHWIWDPSHKNFEASVPKGHQNINVFVRPCTDSCPDKTTLREIYTMKAVKRKILTEPHKLTSHDWCVIDVGQLNKVINDVFCAGLSECWHSVSDEDWKPAMGFFLNPSISSVRTANTQAVPYIRRTVIKILPS